MGNTPTMRQRTCSHCKRTVDWHHNWCPTQRRDFTASAPPSVPIAAVPAPDPIAASASVPLTAAHAPTLPQWATMPTRGPMRGCVLGLSGGQGEALVEMMPGSSITLRARPYRAVRPRVLHVLCFDADTFEPASRECPVVVERIQICDLLQACVSHPFSIPVALLCSGLEHAFSVIPPHGEASVVARNPSQRKYTIGAWYEVSTAEDRPEY